jgi:hypothetical protein
MDAVRYGFEVSAQVEVDLGAHVESVLFVVMCLLLI